ncbi:MAG: MerR family transcriptional regulator [Alphaproteobacteria bacterium]|nr:MerR family transcriptional regulator [Alphaproteobacteria bacterium]
MEKAPEAFRTISEVASDLEVPQHVLRFWETRFAQIKPMKRSGGRRYYRPDDIDLLKGIRRLLYSEGYTIRGVQRILKEHGIKSVQGLADASAAVSFGAIEDAIGQSLVDRESPEIYEEDGEEEAEGEEEGEDEDQGVDFRFSSDDKDEVFAAFRSSVPERVAGPPALDRKKLEAALADLVACRKLLDEALVEH